MLSKPPEKYDIIMECIRDRDTGKYYMKRRKNIMQWAYQEVSDQHSVLILERIYEGMRVRGVVEP